MLDRCEPEFGESDLRDREQARHEEFVAQLHFEHVNTERRLKSAPQDEFPHGGLLPVELLKPGTDHGLSLRGSAASIFSRLRNVTRDAEAEGARLSPGEPVPRRW